MELGAGWRDGRSSHDDGSFADARIERAGREVAGELGERLAIVARICPWGWHRRLDAERLVERLERAYRLDPYDTLWEVEALGYRYAATSPGLAAGGTPPPLPIAELPAESATMLHVGFGMALARRRLSGARGDVAVGVAVRRFLADVERVAPVRLRDAVVEPLGVVARFEHPRSVAAIGRALVAAAPELEHWYWHGVGRCHLFLPPTFLPLPEASWRAARRIERDVPPGLPRRRARVGWACGLTLVHMRQPRILAGVLARHGERIEAARDGFADDFRDGVSQAVEIRRETTPDCGRLVEDFLAHRPAGGHAAAELWCRLVEEPGLRALAAPLRVDESVFSRRRAPARKPPLCVRGPSPVLRPVLHPALCRVRLAPGPRVATAVAMARG